jgi:H+/Cl- antiporter ClcA
MGSWTGLDTSNYALGVLPLPVLERPDVVDLLWTVPFAVAVAVGAYAIMLIARRLLPLLEAREFLMLPLAGLAIGALAIGFSELAGKPFEEVLFSGEAALPGLVEGAETWSVAALAWLMLFKALAWSISLAGFRGGPIFPALFLGAAGGLMASHLAGFDQTAAVAVGMGAATVAILKLPLSAVLLATLLTAQSGSGAMPLVILGVVSAYLVTRVLTTRFESVSRVHAPGAPVAAHA